MLAVIDALLAADEKEAVLSYCSDAALVVYDAEALKAIKAAIDDGEDVLLMVTIAADDETLELIAADLTEEQLLTIGMNSVEEGTVIFSISLTVGEDEITDFGEGIAEIETKYELPEGYEEVVVYRVEKDGTLTEVESKYEDGTLVFFTSKHSTYIAVPTSTEEKECVYDADFNRDYYDILTGEYTLADGKKITVDIVEENEESYYTASYFYSIKTENGYLAVVDGKVVDNAKEPYGWYIENGEIWVKTAREATSLFSGLYKAIYGGASWYWSKTYVVAYVVGKFVDVYDDIKDDEAKILAYNVEATMAVEDYGHTYAYESLENGRHAMVCIYCGYEFERACTLNEYGACSLCGYETEDAFGAQLHFVIDTDVKTVKIGPMTLGEKTLYQAYAKECICYGCELDYIEYTIDGRTWVRDIYTSAEEIERLFIRIHTTDGDIINKQWVSDALKNN